MKEDARYPLLLAIAEENWRANNSELVKSLEGKGVLQQSLESAVELTIISLQQRELKGLGAVAHAVSTRPQFLESVMHGRDLALLWLMTAQGKSGYRDRWKTSYFEPWVSESEEAGLLYHLANELNCAVIAEAHQWRLVASWAALLGVSMINSKPNPKLTLGKESLNLWREKLCALLSDILSLESAINGFSAAYFDDHDVLFKDSRELLTQCKDSAELLILGYNQFAEENGTEPIDLIAVEQSTSSKVGEHTRTFATLARSQALVSAGKLLDAHEEILSLLNSETQTV